MMKMKNFFLISVKRIRNFLNFSSKRTKLAYKISKEYKFEKSNYKFFIEKETFLMKTNYNYLENDNSVLMHLKKEINEHNLLITFRSKNPYDNCFFGQKSLNSYKNVCELYIVINRINEEKGLLFVAKSLDSKINIERILYNEKIHFFFEDYLKATLTADYRGPEVDSLDDKLKKEFKSFLKKNFHINDELGSFVELMSYDKDQRLYFQWLKKINDILYNH